MTWVTWRQHRLQLLAGLAVLVLTAAGLLITGIHIHNSYHALGLDTCLAVAHPTDVCLTDANQFGEQYRPLLFLIPLFLAFPAGVGMFWGAPMLARELEQNTFRVAWTQSVSRTRWMVVKLAIIGVAAGVFCALVTVVLTWWSAPLVDAARDFFDPGPFDLRGIVPIGYGLFAFALGVMLGCVIRRTLPAMVATVASYAAVRGVIAFVVRPHFATPVSVSYRLDQMPATPNDWVLTSTTLDASGHVVGNGVGAGFDALQSICPNLQPPTKFNDGGYAQCIAQHGVHVVSQLQPPDRYWTFQVIELGIFVALAAVLIVAAVWWVRRRLR